MFLHTLEKTTIFSHYKLKTIVTKSIVVNDKMVPGKPFTTN